MLYATTVSCDEEIEQIITLQRMNHKHSLKDVEIQEQGFVTLIYPFETLLHINNLSASVIIKHNDNVVAYALVLPREGRLLFPPLEPMFRQAQDFHFEGRPVNACRFYVMGQVCIAKEYRGQGLFQMLYDKHKKLHEHNFDFVLTDISTQNHRSLRAHKRIGFITLGTYRDTLDEWAMVLWNWT